jgi:hypothetical protein
MRRHGKIIDCLQMCHGPTVRVVLFLDLGRVMPVGLECEGALELSIMLSLYQSFG